MSELTGLEICKRIADIEGKKGHEFMGVLVLSENYNEAVCNRRVYCGHPFANIGESAFPQEFITPVRDNSFRGGSCGKGGKTKYRRT